MSQLFQIHADDLATLEQVMPELCGTPAVIASDNATKRKWRQVQQILTRVRWGYGPFEESEIVGDEE